MNRHAILKLMAVVLIAASLLLTWLFTGIVLSYSDEESKGSFFLKKYPTFKIEFYNLDDSESDYIQLSKLPPDERKIIAEYCKYRYGVLSIELTEIEACRQRTYKNVKTRP